MFKEQTTANIFPIPVWIQLLEAADIARLDEDLLALAERERAASSAYTAGQHWQSRNDLQAEDALTEFRAYVKAAGDHALGALKAEPSSAQMTGCWFNIQPPGGAAHEAHIHPNNFLSGVYYLRATPGANAIVFHDPRNQTNIIAPHYSEPNAYNSRRTTMTIAPGTLILFPAWLSHSVPPNGSDQERISLSFNLMFADFTEQLSRPKWQFQGQDANR